MPPHSTGVRGRVVQLHLYMCVIGIPISSYSLGILGVQPRSLWPSNIRPRDVASLQTDPRGR